MYQRWMQGGPAGAVYGESELDVNSILWLHVHAVFTCCVTFN